MAYKLLWQLTKWICVLIVAATQIQGSTASSGGGAKATFGRSLREDFLLHPDYVSLNHGAYGTYPKAVQTALHAFQARAESSPERWIIREARVALEVIRRELAEVVNCDPEDLVMIPNATSGMNAILRSMIYAVGDKILHFSNVYNAMRSLIQYASDYSNGAVTGLEFDVQWPMNNTEMTAQFEAFIQANLPIRLALIDHISSSPSIVQPLHLFIPILRKYNISVLIDGAHAIGQIPVDLREMKPDYYITNCHKWLYAARGCSMLYVEKSLQASVHPASISSNYDKLGTRFQDEFFWTGTVDYTPYMTVTAALEYRRELGGEEAIRNYTHNLALEGARYLTQRFGTRRMQIDDEQVASMVDVELPIDNPDHELLVGDFWVDTLLYKYNFYCSPYKRYGVWWMRFSVQTYTDMTDFVRAGNVLEKVIDELNTGRTYPPETTPTEDDPELSSTTAENGREPSSSSVAQISSFMFAVTMIFKVVIPNMMHY